MLLTDPKFLFDKNILYLYNSNVKRISIFLLLLTLVSCNKELKRKPPLLDIVEVQSPDLNLTIPEIENLMQSNISNICVPLGTIDNLSSINIVSKVSQNIIFKIIIPENKILLFKDNNFSNNLFNKIQKEIVKCISQQIKITSILFIIEGEKIPDDFKYFNEFLKKLKPLSLSAGIGIPLFYMEKIKGKALEEVDYAVIFSRGFPFPPSLSNSLLNAYRLETAEKSLISFPIPFYFAISIANGAWISSQGTLENYIVGMPFNFITESSAFEFIGANMESKTKNPQYLFEVKNNREINNYRFISGSNINVMLFAYEEGKLAIGKQSKFLNPNYLGRYYYFYSTEENDGVLNFNTWLSYLKAQLTSPIFELQINKESGGFSLTLTNVSGLYSDYSREKNYLEWEYKSGYFKEANPGDFSRFRFYLNEEEVMPVQADRIRYYENFIAPFETLRTGIIKVSGDTQGIFRLSYQIPGGKQKVEILKFK